MWVKQIKFSKLELKLLFRVLVAGIICIIIYIASINITVYYIDRMHVDEDKYNAQINSSAQDFQNYVTDNDLSMNDTDEIKVWDKKQNLMHIKLVENNKVIYDSLDYISRLTPKISYIYYTPVRDLSNVIVFSDGEANLYITILYKQRIEQRLDYVIGILCVLLFIIAILSEFKKLVNDILEIKKGIQILEGGNLSYEINSGRNDEINDLADSINRLSKELDLQRKEDEKLRQKNYDLVTSISHDIRTPLTTVNSYLDLILEKKYNDPSEISRYLGKIKEKTLLINDLTDNLFVHFLNQSVDFEYNYETVIGNDFIKFLLGSMEEDLTDKGYRISVQFDFQEEFFLKVDIMQIQRVFNNLEGNLIKYSQKSMPITYRAVLSDNNVNIAGQNYIQNNEQLDSHGVGIINCKEIIKLHMGEMQTFIEDNIFFITISIPAYQI